MKGITGNPALEAYRRIAVTPVSPAAAASKASPGDERQATEAAKVSISSEARSLAAGGETQVNAQKVEALKSQIADGSFQINSHLVAERLLDSSG
jgi:flagellar biosynthesis anti-sigma factor FlgM